MEFLTSLFIVNPAYAQLNRVLLGKVIDAKTNEPPIGAAIQVENSNLERLLILVVRSDWRTSGGI